MLKDFKINLERFLMRYILKEKKSSKVSKKKYSQNRQMLKEFEQILIGFRKEIFPPKKQR